MNCGEQRERDLNTLSKLNVLSSEVVALPHHVAVRCQGVLRVTVTGLAASVLAVVPVVWSALVAVVARHVLPAWAGAGLTVAVTLSVVAGRLDGPGCHTGAAWKENITG